MAHMLPAPVPLCLQRNWVVSVRAALGKGMEILVQLQRHKQAGRLQRILGISCRFGHNRFIHTHMHTYTFIPAVVVRGVDGAVRQVGTSAELGQTLSMEQGPGTAIVGGKLQTDTNNKKKNRGCLISASQVHKLIFNKKH